MTFSGRKLNEEPDLFPIRILAWKCFPYVLFQVKKTATDISLSNNVTYIVWTRIKNSTVEWRTLTRGYASDHHVIIQSGGWEIGYYDNATNFLGSGYSQQSLPNYGTSNWICLYFVANQYFPHNTV